MEHRSFQRPSTPGLGLRILTALISLHIGYNINFKAMAKTNGPEKDIGKLFSGFTTKGLLPKQGANSRVFLIEDPKGALYALKVIDKNKKKEKDLEGTEEKALKLVSSKFVIPLIDLKESKDYKFFLFPMVEGRTLEEVINEKKEGASFFSNDEILNFGKQMAQAVIDMNRAGVIHQDIKPRNIKVINGGGYMLLDLGIARFKEDGKKGIGRGAYNYSSPEQIHGAIAVREPITFSADHWAIGVIMYEMATLRAPFQDAQSAVKDPVIIPSVYNSSIDKNLAKIILRLLGKRSCDRYSAVDGLLEELNGKEVESKKAFEKPTVFFSLRRTRISNDFIPLYKDSVFDKKVTPYGISLPARSLGVKNELANRLKGQGYYLFIDPETYIEGIMNSGYINRFFKEEQKEILIEESLGKQIAAGADFLISPYFCIGDGHATELSLTTALYGESRKALDRKGIKNPFFGGLFLSRNVLITEEARKCVLDELLGSVDCLDGIYLIAETVEKGSEPIIDRALLAGLRSFIEILSKKIPIILGYGDPAALGLIPYGLSGIVTHPYPSARKINIQQIQSNAIQNAKGGNPPRMAKPVQQFYAPNLLNFIRVTGELDKFIGSQFESAIFCNCPFCKNSGVFSNARGNKDFLRTSWRQQDRYNHYIYNFSQDVSAMAEMKKEEAKNFFLKRIQGAKDIYRSLQANKTQLHKHSSGDFLDSWEDSFR